MESNKSVDTLVNDIQNLLLTGIEHVPEEILSRFLQSTGDTLKDRLAVKKRRDFTLRMSNIGSPCARKLWLEKNYPSKRVSYRPETILKFQYGDLTEEYLLFLAELSGHRVEGRQTESVIAGIKGHRDAVIDGMIVDVKSASSFSFQKFKNGLKPETDSFGYLTQLQSYLYAAQNDPLVTVKDQAAFLAFDKQNGHIHLDIHQRENRNFEKFFQERKAIVNSETIPPRAFVPIPDGKSGNMKLDVNCSYCDSKHACFPGIRTFLYAAKPTFLTKVVRVPNVPELTEENVS